MRYGTGEPQRVPWQWKVPALRHRTAGQRAPLTGLGHRDTKGGRGLAARQRLIVGPASGRWSVQERQCAVLSGFRPPEFLQFVQFRGIAGGEIVALAEVAINVVQLPAVLLEIGARDMHANSFPAFVPDAAAAPQFKILRIAWIRSLRVVEGRLD